MKMQRTRVKNSENILGIEPQNGFGHVHNATSNTLEQGKVMADIYAENVRSL